MKEKIIILLVPLFLISGKAQNLENASYTDKNRNEIPALSFSLPICNKESILDVWKNFIKKQGGKTRGGVINKLNGVNIKFSPGGESWNGSLVYEYEDDKNMIVLTSFQDTKGNYLNEEAGEQPIALSILENFRMDMLKGCARQDLTNAKNYKLSLDKERIRNTDRIMFLEKGIVSSKKKINILSAQEVKEEDKITKLNQDVESYEKEAVELKERNQTLEKEIAAQQIVIQDFQKRMDTLEGKEELADDQSTSEDSYNFDETDPGKEINSTDESINIDNDNVESLDDALELDVSE